MKMKNRNRNANRSGTGSITEFGTALVVLIAFIMMPLLAICSVPCRYMFCQGVLNELATRVAHCEKPSEAAALVKDEGWKRMLASAGVSVSNERLVVRVATSDGAKQYAYSPGQAWPAEWLPNKSPAGSPFVYSLTVSCTCNIPIPGLKAPIKLAVASNATWENLARDPKSINLVYFIEE